MMTRNPLLANLPSVGIVCVLLSAVIYPLSLPYAHLMAVVLVIMGAFMLLTGHLLFPPQTGDSRRDSRLLFQQVLSSVMYGTAAYFMYTFNSHWLVCLLVGAVVDLVVIFRTK